MNVVEPPTAKLYRPGQEADYLWVNSDAIKRIDAITDEPRDELIRPVGDYVAISCPLCDWSRAKWGCMGEHEIWTDYEMHISSRHRGSKTAYITVEATPDHGIDRRAAGKHFRRNVKTDRIELFEFAITDDNYRPSYTATFTVGKWRGDISNAQLSKTLNDKIDFEAFDSVDVDWQHQTPRMPGSVQERIEAVRERES